MFDSTEIKFDSIFRNKFTTNEVKEYLTNLYEEGETALQIAVAAKVMRKYLIPLPINNEIQSKAIDIVGTGGDKSYSFNISSTVSLLLASCGSYVAKHGNRSVTSKSGSADMLEALGINLLLEPSKLIIMLEETGFCFMFAKKHHPSMEYIMPIRKSISHRTIFNILGPLSNPAFVSKQMIGVFSKDYIEKLTQALKILGIQRAMVVSSHDGMDEISISSVTYANFLINGEIKELIIDPQKFGFKLSSKSSIIGGNKEENANITKAILSNKLDDPKLHIILLNAAASLVVDGKARDIKEGIEISKEAILNGKAKEKLEQIIKISNSLK